MKAFVSTLAVLFTLSGGIVPLQSAVAQSGPPQGQGRGERGRGSSDDSYSRDQLEKRFQERLDSIVKFRLKLTDEQHAKLRDVASRTEEARRELRRDEYNVRMAIMKELMAGDRASEKKMGELLDQVPKLDRRRLELTEQEQKELSKFLTPIQRARYFGIQEELRRGMQEMQFRRMQSPRKDSNYHL